jgi:predicted unusual protein kinase regulating ubiquinone biosynthesis (AarF/ABC1/UbiB family)
MFADDPTIFIPKVYTQYSTKHVLVLEWVDGIKVNDYPALEAAGIDRLEVANRVVKAYFHQFFDAGHFHADPHPGNLFVLPGTPESGPIIAFVDFGMVGQMTSKLKAAFKDLFLGFLMRDSHSFTLALAKLGFIGQNANMAAIERGLGLMMERYYGMTLGEAREMDISELSEEIGKLMYGQPFQIPAQFAFAGRAIGTLVGVSTGLAPSFNLIEVATPYAQTFLGLDAGGVSEMLRKLPNQAMDAGRLLLRLPKALDRLITRLDTGQIEVRLAPEVPSGRGRRRRNQSLRVPTNNTSGLSWVLLAGVTMSGGIYLLANANLLLPGWFLLGMSGLTCLRLLIRR